MNVLRIGWQLRAAVGGACFGIGSWFSNWGLLPMAGLAALASCLPGRRPGVATFVWAAVACGCGLEWALRFGAAPWAAITGYHCLYVLPVAGCARICRAACGERGSLAKIAAAGLLVAGAFSGLEMLRGLGPFGVSMLTASGPVADNAWLRQWAAVGGVQAVTLMVALVAAMAGMALAAENRQVRKRGLQAAVIVLVAAHLVGAVLYFRGSDGRSMRVAALQGVMDDGFNEVKDEDRAPLVYMQLAREAAKAGARLTVWPETSYYPGNICVNSDEQAVVANISRETGMVQIVGSICETQRDGNPTYYNNALGFDSDGKITGSYDKMRLTPFGEYVPFRDMIPSLERWGVTEVDYSVGREWPLIPAAGVEVGVLICSETMFSDVAMGRLRSGAALLAVMSNDSWFGRGPGTKQLVWLTVMRAVETGLPVVRAAETGYSAIIDSRGNTIARSRLYRKQALAADLSTSRRNTLFSRHSGASHWIGLAAAAIGLLLWLVVRRR